MLLLMRPTNDKGNSDDDDSDDVHSVNDDELAMTSSEKKMFTKFSMILINVINSFWSSVKAILLSFYNSSSI